MRHPVLFLVLAACVTPPPVSPPVVLRPTTPHATPNGPNGNGGSTAVSADVSALFDDMDGAKKALEAVRSLTDEVGPRLAGSPGDVAAVEWAERTMTGLGFSNVHHEVVKIPRWERGVETASLVAPAQTLAVTALGGSVGTPAAGIEAELVRAEDLEALDQLAPNDVRGRIVYLATVMEREQTMAGYGKAVGARVMGAIAASKKGAVAVLVRSIGTDDNRLPHTGFVKMPEPADGIPAIPAAALSVPDADMLDRLYDLHKNVRIRLKLGCHRLAEGRSANVIGDIVGHDKPTEIVLAGAHLDSWDLGRGALDDGAGVGIVLAAAKMVAQHRTPKRTIRVVLFAAEEMSAAGARAYATDHAAEIDHHVAAIEADQGDGPPLEVRWLGGAEGRTLAAELADNVSQLGATYNDDAAYGGTDIAPLLGLGVPVVDIVQDASTYFDYHHTANDTFDKVDESSIATATRAYAIALWTLSEAKGDLGRVPPSKRTRK
jgi:hypothetical protein